MSAAEAIWHDLECGSYRADLPLWRRLAAQHDGPVLEIGAGTGRVAIELARHGHRVTALDIDPDLLAELARRATELEPVPGGLALTTVAADAREFELDERFGLIAVPMQAIQLLGGPAGRARFLSRAGAHLAPGGRVALALTEAFELYDCTISSTSSLPLADVREFPGGLYRSQPTAVREDGREIVLERRREILGAGGPRVEEYQIRLDRLSAAALEREGVTGGLRPLARVTIAPTSDHVGSVVVILGG